MPAVLTLALGLLLLGPAAGLVHDSTAAVASRHDVLASSEAVHVCMSTDEADLRGVVAAVNSTYHNAANPLRLVFHVVVPPSKVFSSMLTLYHYFPPAGNIRLEVVGLDSALDARIRQYIHKKAGARERQDLLSVFNFVPFYLDRIIAGSHPRRIVYLDTDTLVVGDLTALADMSLDGKPAGAAEDCSQRLKTYIDFKRLGSVLLARDAPLFAGAGAGEDPYGGVTQGTCVFNRGVFVMDVEAWQRARVTDEIEWWLRKDGEVPLYHHGVTQPPWLLALAAHGYKKLGQEWNSRGLGRDYMLHGEIDALGRQGLTQDLMMLNGVSPDRTFVNAGTGSARVLHFNGRNKPWKQPRCQVSLCHVAEGQRLDLERSKCPHVVSFGAHKFAECSALWWPYFTA